MTTHTNTHRTIHWLVAAAAAATVGAALFTGSPTAFADDGVSNTDQQGAGTVVVAPPAAAEQPGSSGVMKKYNDTAKTIVRNIRG